MICLILDLRMTSAVIHVFILHTLEHRTITVSSHQVGVQMKGCGQMARIVLLCRPTVHHKESDPVLKVKCVVTH